MAAREGGGGVHVMQAGGRRVMEYSWIFALAGFCLFVIGVMMPRGRW